MISILTVDSFQDKNKYQISNFHTLHRVFAEQSTKLKKTEMMRIIVQFASSEVDPWIAQPKLEELSLIFTRFLRTLILLIHTRKFKEKKLLFLKEI